MGRGTGANAVGGERLPLLIPERRPTMLERICHLCGTRYPTPHAARLCEELGFPEPLVSVGDIVFTRDGFGWFDGDPAWVANFTELFGRRSSEQPDHLLEGPKHPEHGNCFDACCTYRFYYVVTHIDRAGDDSVDRRDAELHRTRYHLVTDAMKQSYRSGWTYDAGHYRPEIALEVPESVRVSAKALIGTRASGLL